ncbi:TPA: ead/Ea22-like family protein [Enterobacter hormaechei]|uniref:hypothetical protein n=1 Tax=Enterobacter hormaechei TaxID=158836 RepID=UPI0007921197|nr:hypothetical protein [Enterobacter hormaechei]CAE6352042.1 hypothetical protein AI2716V1_2128 [Enterobacter cloacae]CAH3477252.1 hypothetical protein AI2716V1_2128 [Enterobacter cloacae]CZV75026.1 Uncharacterised protein [Enterobacter hormaechei]
MSIIDKQTLTEESARESGNILLIVAARMARGELFTPLRYVSELPQKAVGMRTFRDALERSEETLLREVHKIVDGHDRMAKKLKETEAKLEAAEKRIAELEALEVNLPKLSVGEVMHMSGFSRDYAEGWCSGNDNAIHEIHATGVKVAAAAGKGG